MGMTASCQGTTGLVLATYGGVAVPRPLGAAHCGAAPPPPPHGSHLCDQPVGVNVFIKNTGKNDRPGFQGEA